MQKTKFNFEARWTELGDRIGVVDKVAWERAFDAITAMYSEDGRYYHSLKHVQDCVEKVKIGKEIATDINAVEVALWFHDAFNDVYRHDNEERSAIFARESLINAGVNRKFAENVERIILFTKHKVRPKDIDAQLAVDIDLSSLAAPREIFVKNTEDIRKEFSRVDTASFRRGRAELLQGFLDRDPLYMTEPFRERYEEAAKDNLRKTIKELRAAV